MLKPLLAVGSVVAAPALLYVTLGDVSKEVTSAGTGGFVIPSLSISGYDGKEFFSAHCASCHGAYGEGSTVGPKLIHPLYAPDVMPDTAIHTAITQGATARNWPFGDMPPNDTLSDAKIDSIIGFLREVQAANEIY